MRTEQEIKDRLSRIQEWYAEAVNSKVKDSAEIQDFLIAHRTLNWVLQKE